MIRNSTTKMCTLMRSIVLYGLMTSISSSFAGAHARDTQVLDTPIPSISIQDAPLDQALKLIEQAANVKFVYSVNTLRVTSHITFQGDKVRLSDVLDQVLPPLNISYKVYEVERSITLQRVEAKEKEENQQGSRQPSRSPTSLELLLAGQVTDAISRTPIAGANIIIKGTTNGTTTDANGRFSIEANSGDRLVISFIGYKPQEIEVSNQTEISIELSEDVSSLEEVVVNAGYYTVTQKEQTGNIQRVSREDIGKQPVSNPLNALTGRMTGVYVQQMTGVPGGGINIQIRGQNSLRNGVFDNGNLPLYIVDGVPFTSTSLTTNSGSNLAYGSPLSAINPSDIESIEILKDADATAIYGSRGANGVVLITTIKGQTGKPQITFNHAEGFGTISRKMPLMNTSDYLDMRRAAFRNDGSVPQQYNAPDLLLWDTTRYTDWQKVLIGGTARTSNSSAAISGGSQNTHFQLSLSHYRETTVFPGDYAYNKFAGHSFLNHTSENKKFSLDLTTSYVFENNHIPTGDFTPQAINLAPNAPKLYNDDGSLNWENSTWTNPLAATRTSYKARTSNLIANSNISYRIAEGLVLKTNVGFTAVNVTETALNPISSQNPGYAYVSGSASQGNNKIATWIVEPRIDYQKQFGPSSLKLLVGSTFQESIREGTTILGYNYTSDALIDNIQAAPQLYISNTNYVQYRYNAVFGRINYALKDRYIINLTARRDGSSRFGPQKRIANFGAIGAGWIFSEEEFIRNFVPALSHGKLRASYGLTGSDQISDYNFLDTYATNGSYAGTTAINPSRLANPSYSWETNRKGEVGIELGFFKDRFIFNLSAYRNISSNQLVGFPVASTTGFTSVQSNLPAEVENKGLEFELRSVNISGSAWQWTTSLNLTIPHNTLLSYPGIDQSSYARTYTVGEPLNYKKYFQFTGVDPSTGIYKFLDKNKDGEITRADDWVSVANGQRFYGGITNNIKFRGLELDVMFQYVRQRAENYIAYFSAPGTLTSFGSNQPQIVSAYWRAEMPDSFIQRPTQDYASDSYQAFSLLQNSNQAISDASFLRLRTLSFSYTLPAKWIDNTVMKSCKVYAQGQNLLTFTKYLGWDPESLSIQSLPPLRILSAGIQISF